MNSEYCRDKLSQYKIGGPSRPFIDQNLQFQLPNWDSYSGHIHSHFHSPIYSHYVGSSPSSSLSLPINEEELYHVMKEAEYSYEAWKKMQVKLQETIKAYSSR